MTVTRKAIIQMIELGAAEDWTKRKDELPEATRILFTSHGLYGCTGIVGVGLDTGELYASTNRSQALALH